MAGKGKQRGRDRRELYALKNSNTAEKIRVVQTNYGYGRLLTPTGAMRAGSSTSDHAVISHVCMIPYEGYKFG